MSHRFRKFLILVAVLSTTNAEPVDVVGRDGVSVAWYKLNNGQTLPVVGFGTSQIGNTSITKTAVKSALETGYRLIDTATRYDNEEAIGEALEELISENKIHRDDVFVTTKVWPNSFTAEGVLQSIRDSLKRLRLDRLDLVLMHFPAGFQTSDEIWPIYDNGSVIPLSWNKNSFVETWKTMEEAVKLNLTKSIGVSNFNSQQMDTLMESATIKPVLNQVECNPVFNQATLLDNHKRHGVILQAYAPIGRANPNILTSPVLQKIGGDHNKTSAQVSLRWLVQRGASLVIKSKNPKRIASNLAVFDFELSNDEMTQIDQLKQEPRMFKFAQARNHPDYPF